MIKFKKYSKVETLKNTFLQFPLWLEYVDISHSAKILYIYILDRYKLSIKNNWIDQDQNIYCYFKIDTLASRLKLSNKTVIKYMKELENHDLLLTIRQGLNKPNKIYVTYPTEEYLESLINEDENKNTEDEYEDYKEENMMLESVGNTQKCKLYTSEKAREDELIAGEEHYQENKRENGNANFTHQEVKSLHPSHTNISQTEYINNHSFISYNDILEKNENKSEENERMNEKTQIQKLIDSIKTQIDYDSLSERFGTDIANEYVYIIADVLESKDKIIKIKGLEKNIELVKAQYRKLNYFSIEEAIERLDQNPKRITDTASYIKTLLYDVSLTNNTKLRNTVRYDMTYGNY